MLHRLSHDPWSFAEWLPIVDDHIPYAHIWQILTVQFESPFFTKIFTISTWHHIFNIMTWHHILPIVDGSWWRGLRGKFPEAEYLNRRHWCAFRPDRISLRCAALWIRCQPDCFQHHLFPSFLCLFVCFVILGKLDGKICVPTKFKNMNNGFLFRFWERPICPWRR